ncbi:MFS transporter [Paenarthrobacter sp. DKR-5]|uniref:MFS transporter n=1 Tax=Paenarthrobacter sp. DKR-5 TaxID=2835535 RepID=UPI001BDCFD4E|nr:MFS transporter [Paenarthrobacter sp. DKR-5]MBT1001455.1 MFS transporter [Paenarthrobacter sp. DKR-5]
MTPPPAPAVETATAPVPLVSERLPWRHTFLSLKVPNFRIFAASHLVAVVALWMQRIAQDWLVLQLSGSVTAVGVTVAMQFAPMLLLGPLGGVVADRYSKRRLLMITQSVAALMAAVLAVLALTGVIQVWHVYAVALVLGLVTVVDNPSRQVFVHELVGPQHLRNAISVNSSIFQVGSMLGPAISGILLTTVGGGWAFAINAVACCVTVFSLGSLKAERLVATPAAPRAKGQLKEGFAYAVSKPTILYPAIMAAFVAVFALSTPVLMAAFADHVFHSGASGYGLLNTLLAVGALTGAVTSTRRTTLRLRTVVGSAGAFGFLMALAAFAPNELSFCLVMVAAGCASLLFLTAANQLVQVSSNLTIRGRVMSLYIMVLLGGQALGGPLIGSLAERIDPHAALLVAGGVPAVAAVVVALVLSRKGHLTLTFNLRRPRGLVRIVERRSTPGSYAA